MIELAEVIGELRRELQAAMNDGVGEQLRFELGPVELEATVVVREGGRRRGQGPVLGDRAGRGRQGQRGLDPPRQALPAASAGRRGQVWVASDEEPGER
jgi:hypothetical protein